MMLINMCCPWLVKYNRFRVSESSGSLHFISLTDEKSSAATQSENKEEVSLSVNTVVETRDERKEVKGQKGSKPLWNSSSASAAVMPLIS